MQTGTVLAKVKPQLTIKEKVATGLGVALFSALLPIMVQATPVAAAQVTVKAGDTVSELAEQYDTTVNAIETANGVNTSTHVIVVGDTLNINGSGDDGSAAASTVATGAVQVTVKAGDTVWAYAQRYNVSIAAIESANQITGHLIYVGDVLTIPGTASQAAVSQPQSTASQQTASAPAANTQAATSQPAASSNTASTSTSTYQSTATGSESDAKAWIAYKESRGSYTAQNGQYYGKYQMTSSYLNGDYSPANQEKTADNYVANRYGSWTAAQAFWQAHGWY